MRKIENHDLFSQDFNIFVETDGSFSKPGKDEHVRKMIFSYLITTIF